MKTPSNENKKGKTAKGSLTCLVVFIVEKQIKSVQPVNYSVNSTKFFFPQLL